MKNVNSTFIAEKNKNTNQPVTVFTLHDYDSAGNNLNLADYDADVVYNGITYSKFPIKFLTIDENAQGQVDAVRIQLLNISRVIQSYLETYDLRQKKVTIKVIWANQLADASAYLDFVYYIDSYTADQENVEFVCTTKMDVIDLSVPSEVYLRSHCRWKIFKDPDTCGYAGSESTCNRTMQRCKELNNFSRFGGFPSLPTRRLYVA